MVYFHPAVFMGIEMKIFYTSDTKGRTTRIKSRMLLIRAYDSDFD